MRDCGSKLQGQIRNALGFSVLLLGDLRPQITFAPRFLLIGLALMIAMLGSVWGIGQWRGRKKAMRCGNYHASAGWPVGAFVFLRRETNLNKELKKHSKENKMML